MNSSLRAEIVSVFLKECRAELRSRHAFFTGGLFAFVAVVAMAFSQAEVRLSPSSASGAFSVVLLFAASVVLPRIFLMEDEIGTIQLLRLTARPASVFWGKAMFAWVLLLGVALGLATLFVLLANVTIVHFSAFFIALILECFTLASVISVTGVLVTGANNRWLLGTVVGMPLLLPQLSMSMGVLKFAFGASSASAMTANAVGLSLFGLAMVSFGPLLANLLWRLEGSSD